MTDNITIPKETPTKVRRLINRLSKKHPFDFVKVCNVSDNLVHVHFFEGGKQVIFASVHV